MECGFPVSASMDSKYGNLIYCCWGTAVSGWGKSALTASAAQVFGSLRISRLTLRYGDCGLSAARLPIRFVLCAYVYITRAFPIWSNLILTTAYSCGGLVDDRALSTVSSRALK